jgi:hypothetical protein
MRDPKHLRDKAFELRCQAVHARTEASARRRISVARKLEAEASALERTTQSVRPQAPG